MVPISISDQTHHTLKKDLLIVKDSTTELAKCTPLYKIIAIGNKHYIVEHADITLRCVIMQLTKLI